MPYSIGLHELSPITFANLTDSQQGQLMAALAKQGIASTPRISLLPNAGPETEGYTYTLYTSLNLSQLAALTQTPDFSSLFDEQSTALLICGRMDEASQSLSDIHRSTRTVRPDIDGL